MQQLGQGVEQTDEDDFYFILMLTLNENKQIEIRRVIGLMQFLSDTGGFYSSLFIISSALNFLLSGQD